MTHVLITRPEAAARELADDLGEAGLQPIVMPLFAFRARQPDADIGAAWRDTGQRRLAVFTSPRAVQYGLSHVPAGPGADIDYAAVGAATRERLEKAGCKVGIMAPSGYTSEDLLTAPELTAEPGAAVIFAAPGGREALARGLARLGWDVTTAMVYERCPLQPGKSQIEAIEAADSLVSVWTSVSALDLAQKSLPEAAWKKLLASPMLVISARMAHHLQSKGARSMYQASGPGNAELLQSVRKLVESDD